MKNREERLTNLDRGATQQTFGFGNEDDPTPPADFLRPEVTDPAFADTPSLSVSSETDLMKQIVDPRNLERAWRRVKKNRGAPGPDGMTIGQFESWCPEHWPAIQQQLLDGSYRPASVRRKTIPKDGGGERSLGIPNVLDRLIQQAICQVLTPIFDPGFSESSFGFRPNRSAHGATRRVQQIIRQRHEHCVDVDLSKFFDRVQHDVLMSRVNRSGMKWTCKGARELLHLRCLRASGYWNQFHKQRSALNQSDRKLCG